MFKLDVEQIILGNRLVDYFVSIFIFILGIFMLKIFKKVFLKYLKKRLEKIGDDVNSFLIATFQKALIPLFYYGVFYMSIRGLKLIPFLAKAVDVLGITFLTIFAIRFILGIITCTLESYLLKKEKNTSRVHSMILVLTILKIIVWGMGIFFVLDNLGFKVSAILAGLGIGGIAVALAVQSILGDLFSYFAIFLDRPFEIGDFIITGDYLGTVEHIGIKTTRVRSLDGEELVFSNTDLTSSRIRNYKRMEKRRVVFKIGVTYRTSLELLKEIPKIIKNIIININDSTLDRVHFFSYGDFSLIFEVVYYVNGSDYNKYMDIQQEINFKIKEEFDKKSIEFAYPTQTIFLNKA